MLKRNKVTLGTMPTADLLNVASVCIQFYMMRVDGGQEAYHALLAAVDQGISVGSQWCE